MSTPPQRQTSPEETASFFSRLYFFWVQPTLKRGMREPLTVATLLPLNSTEDTVTCDRAFVQCYGTFAAHSRPVLRTMWALHYSTFWRVFGISLLHLSAGIASPLLLRRLLNAVAEAGHAGNTVALTFAALLFLSALTTSMTAHHMFHILLKLMTRVRTALIAAIYRKAMNLTVAARQEAPPGQIINLMGTDAQKFVNCLNVAHSLWMHPLQLFIVLCVLYSILGTAALAGAAVLILFLLISARISRRYISARQQLVVHTDERVGLMNEILASIKLIKFYAWEASFAGEVQAIRAKEVVQLTRLARLSAVSTLIFLSSPVIVAVVTFATFVLSGHALNAADVFASLALFNLMRMAMVTLPDVVTNFLEANVAVRRVEKFLRLPELPPRVAVALSKGMVRLEHARCEWTPGKVALDDLSLTIAPGELVSIVGPVGAGKSALLAALLGDIATVSGVIEVSGKLAYVSQQAWILNDTVRNNVLFGKEFDSARYLEALAVSGLDPDLAQLPSGDLTEVGERGVGLSGGQRQRLSLARAVYHDADIVLLDDPLSAVDSQVGRQVFAQCIKGALAKRTRILTTHRLEYVDGTDRILVMHGGRIVESGSPRALRQHAQHFSRLWQSYERHGEPNTELEAEDAEGPKDEASGRLDAVPSPLLTTKASTGNAALTVSASPRLMTEEERQTGVVDWAVYRKYFSVFAPGALVGVLLGACLLKEGLNTGTDSWLAYWSSATPFRLSLFLGGYLGLGLLACSSTFARSLLIALRGLTAGTQFHSRILTSVLRAPMGFFEGTPVGRILNRFSRDMEAIDQQIPRSLHEVLGCIFTIMTTLSVVVFVTPLALFAIIPIAVVYYYVQRYFRPVSREGQRLDSITRSPIFAQFSETLAGASVIRAYGAVPRFEQQLLVNLGTNSQSFYTIVSANRWLGTRIESLGAAVVATAAFASAFAGAGAPVGFVGLSVTYSLAITGAMNWAVRMFSQLESNLNSVERVEHYSQLPAERWEGGAPAALWPTQGAIRFEHVTLCYRIGLEPVISDLNCIIAGGEKIGVVGRTGAGKSTLLLGLFRVLELSSGRIVIDDVDIATLALADLRQRLAIIPQDPLLFRGTVRKNLDPFGRCSDTELWDALGRAALAPLVRGLPNALDSDVHDGGGNFSVGQRQLLCLARALLRRSRILLMDEATASVDVTTDLLIQRTIRTEFAAATVITIAHRLGTVMDYDRIMVLERGQLIEFGAPKKLAQSRGGALQALLREEQQSHAASV